MGIYTPTGALKVVVNDTTAQSGLYTADGSLRVTTVPGTSYTGRYAPDGSLNVVDEDGPLNHPCGALRGKAALLTYTGLYSPFGALYMDGLIVGPFDPLSLFAANETGVWYDPSDIQNYTTLGTELVTNGTFESNITGWTNASAAGGTIAWNSLSYLDLINTTGAATARQQVTVVSGREYAITFDHVSSSPSPASVQIFVGTTAGGTDLVTLTNVDTGTRFSKSFVATSTAAHITLRLVNAGTCSVDNVSIREVTVTGTPTMFQNNSSILTPVTTAGAPVGLIIDKSKNLAISSEKVLNGNFSNGVSNWITFSSTLTNVSGRGFITTTAASLSGAYQSISTVAGKVYRMSMDFERGTATEVYVSPISGITLTSTQASGTFNFYFVAGSSSTNIGMGITAQGVSGTTAYFDNISVKVIDGIPASQGTTTSRPSLQQDLSGKYYLAFDGTDDGLATSSINFTSSNKMTLFAGVRKLVDGAPGIIAELSATSSSNAGSIAILAPGNTGLGNYSLRSNGGTLVTATSASSFAAPVTNVLSCASDTVAPSATIRVNGSQSGSTTASQGGGSFGIYPIFVGSRNNSGSYFSGRLYSFIVLGRAATAGEIGNTETWINGKTGAY